MEQASGSPPVKDRTHSRPKPYHVHFDPSRTTGVDWTAHRGHTQTHSSARSTDGGLKGKEGGKENNEYLVEPKALNELEAEQGMEYEPRGAYVSQTSLPKGDGSTGLAHRQGSTLSSTQRVHSQASLTKTSELPYSSSAAFSQRYNSTVSFSVPSTTTSSSTLRPSPTSHPHTITKSNTSTRPFLSTASPSDPYIPTSPHSRLGGTSAAYSNATAVFGPPVKFSDHSSRHVPTSSRQPTVVRPAEVCTM